MHAFSEPRQRAQYLETEYNSDSNSEYNYGTTVGTEPHLGEPPEPISEHDSVTLPEGIRTLRVDGKM